MRELVHDPFLFITARESPRPDGRLPSLAELARLPLQAAAVHASCWPEQVYAPEVCERIDRVGSIEAWRYLQAQQTRRQLVHDLFAELDDLGADALLTITTQSVAPRRNGDPAVDRAGLRHVVPLSQTGGPVLAVPAAQDNTTGLPLGVQLAGPPRSEAPLLALGAHLDHALPMPDRARLAPRRPTGGPDSHHENRPSPAEPHMPQRWIRLERRPREETRCRRPRPNCAESARFGGAQPLMLHSLSESVGEL